MSTSVSSVTSHFPDAENGFTTTTSGSVAAGATTVGLNSTAGYTNGKPVVFVIDPSDATKKQTFTGIIDTSGNQVTSVVWTAGTNVAHSAGATVVDYATATHIAMVSKGMEVEHNQDGTHDEALITSRTADTSPASGDFLLTSDVSATNALKKVTVSNLFAAAPSGTTPTTTLTNPYKFFAYRNAAQNSGNNAWAKVNLDTELFDTGSNFDNATNYRFTAPAAGFYSFDGAALFTAPAGGAQTYVSLYKNGAEYVRGTGMNTAGAGNQGGTVGAIIQLAATDYIELYFFTNSAAGALIAGASPIACYLSGHLVSAT